MIINFSPVLKPLRHSVYTEMFSVTNFVLSKNHLVTKRFVLSIVVLKKWFSSSYLENAMKYLVG